VFNLNYTRYVDYRLTSLV